MTAETTSAPGEITRRWVPVTSLVLSVLGLAVSGYMTLSHYTDQAVLVCSTNAVIDCARVTSSPQSMVFGIPVAVLGLVFFVGMCVLNLPALWRSADQRVRLLRFASVGVGIVFVAYLVAVELLILHVICEWCTVVHVLTIALFAVTVLGETSRRSA
ncbi:vitamin K epoxide reductase family protein [Allokutzneria oryzae]|uniref:Vitamin K epoxide reductase family protein n=1 Tax=Allokutzneria oryzae TaxID=1378989 RepID=A0ABV5ZPH3_9PSEU